MTCYHPLKAWYGRTVGKSGKRGVVFKAELAHPFLPALELPCGQCVGCRLERSRQWAMRCMHEASLYEKNCFITLTYRDPPCFVCGGSFFSSSLFLPDFQNFMKRLRKRFGSGVRYFHCGEYGAQLERPHYHACLFNFDFPDREFLKLSGSGHRLYGSRILDELWTVPGDHRPLGFSWIGDVTFESAAYVARYIMKKVTGENAVEHYERVDPVTGEITRRMPEYVTMSRRPGVGRAWYERYVRDVFPDDFVIVNGVRCKPPKFYDRLFEVNNPEDWRAVRARRVVRARKGLLDQTAERLAVREEVLKAKLRLLPRKQEE